MPRSTTKLSAVIAVMGAAAMAGPPLAVIGNGAGQDLTRTAAPAFARVSAIPSHNGVYQASLVAPSSPIAGSGPDGWTVEVRTAAGTPVENAALALESWMPDDARVNATRPRATRYLGDGRYRVDGLRLDQHGWWNVRLEIAASVGTDSLAFNLVR